MITISSRGPDIPAALDKAARKAPKVATAVAVDAVELIARRARQLVPTETGRARSSIKVDDGKGRATVVAGGPRARHFGWLDYGGLLRKQNISRPYKRGGRYIYPAAGDVWPKVRRALDAGAADIVKATGLR